MVKKLRSKSSGSSIMEELLAKQTFKVQNLFRGQEVEGKVVFISDSEVILDLGTKSEGVLPKRDIPADVFSKLKVGDTFKAFVFEPESESGQVILSSSNVSYIYRSTRTTSQSKGQPFWNKFIQAKQQQTRLFGKIIEANKGGLMIDALGIKGFLPTSQINLEKIIQAARRSDSLKDETVEFFVIEVDERGKRLVFSQRDEVSADLKSKLDGFKTGDQVSGKVLVVLPFGLIVDVDNIPGVLYISEVSWERQEDLSKLFKSGEKIEAQVLEKDQGLGGLSLSIRKLTPDPFIKLSEKYQPDDTLKGTVNSIQPQGVNVALEGGIEGFIPSSRLGEVQYKEGDSVNLIVDSIDIQRRRINLAPFIITTKGLIYK